MVHTFKCLEKYFALDVESGSLFQTDELTNKLINEINSPDSFSAGEFSCFSEGELNEARAEIEQLENEGVLFSSEPVHKEIPDDGVIKSLCLNISHKCNLRCSYCFADGGSYCGEEENMSFATAKAAVDFLIEKSGARKILEIDFFGGEPLINMDVVRKTVEYGRKREKDCKKTFRFTITTNAVSLSDEITDFFNKEMYNVVLSIDGRENVHNQVRKTVNGKGSYDIVLKNILDFRKKRGDRQYYVRGTFTSQNKDFASDAESLSDAGFDQISLEPVVLPDSHPLALKMSDTGALNDEYERLARLYLERLGTAKQFNFFHFQLDMSGGPCEAKRLKNCGAGCEYAAITPSGQIYPCHQFASNKDYLIGNVLTGEFDRSVTAKFKDNTILKKDDCKECWAKYYCSGGCAANSVNFNGSLLKPVKVSCALMKKRTECALALYCLQNF